MIDKIAGFFKRCEPQTIFRIFMQHIVNVLVVYIILVLSIGLIRTLSGVKNFFINMPIGQTFNIVVTEILTFLVIIELFRSFIDYFEAHRFRLNTMIDPAIMFVIRELIVKLYNQQGINWQGLSGFGFLIACLGIVRTLAVRFSPGEDDRHRMG
jgi:uncharacterized membrane protein (DUF373 family)